MSSGEKHTSDPSGRHCELSIIVVNWRSLGYVSDCLASIYTHEGVRPEYEIIVFDNASPGENVDVLKELFPMIRLVKHPYNVGFAAANNCAVEQARGDVLLFLNPDTVIEYAAITALLGQFRSLSRPGVLGCRLLNADRSIQLSAVQRFPTIMSYVADNATLQRLWPACPLWRLGSLFSESRVPVGAEAISGACMMVERDTFMRAGMFDEKYFMYSEDIDLCYRMQQLGRANWVAPSVSVVHYGGRSSEPAAATAAKWRAILRYLRIHRGIVYVVAFRFVLAAAAAARIGILLGIHALVRRPESIAAVDKWRTVLRILLAAR